MAKANQAQSFIKDIENILGKEKNEVFRNVFKQYKTGVHPVIEEFSKDLFEVMFGNGEHAICHLDIPKYI